MKKALRILLIIGVALMATACGAKPDIPEAADKASQKDASNGNTLEEIKKKGEITIAVDDTFPPMNYRNDKNELVGFDVDLAKAVSEELGVKVNFIPTAWDGILPGLDAKRYDIIMSSMGITDERKQKVDFVEYLRLGQILAVQSGNPLKIQTKEDLSGKIVGVQMGSTSESAAKEIAGVKELKSYNGYTDVFNDLALGRVEGVIVAEAVGRYYKTLKPEVFDVTGDPFLKMPVGIAVRKEDDSLEKALNDAVQKLQENGTFSEISNKWFGEDVTKQ
ncbi:amino acid ABC transporter substrate-binding protein [Neobacillus piezotolerans]|uniref:Amino acid ABC transporter substrate-binding protein n=1 Tax=Neobacillus piezotolerans TaxID=2259171 RepID=A0A3D8GPS4_9BACI|nr:ABC transporter substrate-binding protein [Neobacillus piezotolerans]RDU36493.1 amino acid ABC transporter substrate-binding protein [Neobacillus piezotolerans]